MDTVFLLVRSFSVFIVPLFITGIPLALLLFLIHLNRIRQSAGLTILATAFSTLIGCWTPFLGTVICGGILASGMPDDQPKCVTGAVMFIPIGYLFTGITLVVGIGLTLRQLLRPASSPSH